jgi:hypothetical protein
MITPSSRFYPANDNDNRPSLFIENFVWWMDNEREILNWMVDHLPRGIEHQTGMAITFDSEQDRLMFLMRWS